MEQTAFRLSQKIRIRSGVLSYAVTVYKSQGSEYPIVVTPITMSQFTMLQRNLLDTGMTRAKKIFVMAGTAQAVRCTVYNNKVAERNRQLLKRLQNNIR